jgi:hypothetical protein
MGAEPEKMRGGVLNSYSYPIIGYPIILKGIHH